MAAKIIVPTIPVSCVPNSATPPVDGGATSVTSIPSPADLADGRLAAALEEVASMTGLQRWRLRGEIASYGPRIVPANIWHSLRSTSTIQADVMAGEYNLALARALMWLRGYLESLAAQDHREQTAPEPQETTSEADRLDPHAEVVARLLAERANRVGYDAYLPQSLQGKLPGVTETGKVVGHLDGQFRLDPVTGNYVQVAIQEPRQPKQLKPLRPASRTGGTSQQPAESKPEPIPAGPNPAKLARRAARKALIDQILALIARLDPSRTGWSSEADDFEGEAQRFLELLRRDPEQIRSWSDQTLRDTQEFLSAVPQQHKR